MHVRLLFPKDYLAAPDLVGREVTLTMSRIVSESLHREGGDDEQKWCLYFEEMEKRHRGDRNQPNKRLVLNKTNAKTIAKLHGNETDEWAGKKITLYPTTCQAFGDTVDCIRIKE
jgi:hypothetical protein